MTGRTFYGLSTGLMITAVSVCVYFFHRGFYAVSWDESGRTLDAYRWFAHGVPLTRVWLPFYRVLVGSAFRLYPDLFITPRIVTCIFGLAAIPAGAWLTHELFQNRTTTLLAMALNTFLSQRIALSLAPLSDIMFVAAILFAMAAFARWLRTDSRAALWTCALAAAISSTIRYEGWVFNMAILMAAGYRHFTSGKPGRAELVLWAAALFSYPGVWVATQFTTINPIRTVISDARQFSTREILKRNPLAEFISGNAVILNLAGLFGIWQVVSRGEWRQKAMLAVAFFPLAFASLILLVTRSAQSSAAWRMSCVWTMLLIPFTARFVSGKEWSVRMGRIAPAIQVCAAALLLTAFFADTFRLERDTTWAFPQSDKAAGEYLNGFISKAPDTKVLVESSLFFYVALQVASQHPDSFVENSLPEQPGPPILATAGPIRSVVESQKIGLLVFRTEEYKRFLDSSPDVVKVEEFGPWSIYRPAP